jgi:hypothetical protein
VDSASLEAAFRAPPPDRSLARLTRRFEHAFRATQDLDSAMAAVNELLDRPLSYQEFIATIRK